MLLCSSATTIPAPDLPTETVNSGAFSDTVGALEVLDTGSDVISSVSSPPLAELGRDDQEYYYRNWCLNAIVCIGNSPTDLSIYLIDAVHSLTGLPWWATIAASTVVLRSLLFPVTLSSVCHNFQKESRTYH